MDQRRSESLNRFLMRRAMRNAKNPQTPPRRNCYGPFSSVRWRFSATKRSIELRVGIIGVHFYWRAIVPVPNNVSVNQRLTGIILYPLFRIVPGQEVPCLRLVKAGEPFDEYEAEGVE